MQPSMAVGGAGVYFTGAPDERHLEGPRAGPTHELRLNNNNYQQNNPQMANAATNTVESGPSGPNPMGAGALERIACEPAQAAYMQQQQQQQHLISNSQTGSNQQHSRNENQIPVTQMPLAQQQAPQSKKKRGRPPSSTLPSARRRAASGQQQQSSSWFEPGQGRQQKAAVSQQADLVDVYEFNNNSDAGYNSNCNAHSKQQISDEIFQHRRATSNVNHKPNNNNKFQHQQQLFSNRAQIKQGDHQELDQPNLVGPNPIASRQTKNHMIKQQTASLVPQAQTMMRPQNHQAVAISATGQPPTHLMGPNQQQQAEQYYTEPQPQQFIRQPMNNSHQLGADQQQQHYQMISQAPRHHHQQQPLQPQQQMLMQDQNQTLYSNQQQFQQQPQQMIDQQPQSVLQAQPVPHRHNHLGNQTNANHHIHNHHSQNHQNHQALMNHAQPPPPQAVAQQQQVPYQVPAGYEQAPGNYMGSEPQQQVMHNARPPVQQQAIQARQPRQMVYQQQLQPQMAPVRAPVGRPPNQYKQQPNSTLSIINYQQQQQQPQFIPGPDEQQYPSNSPTLLQQQLNRQHHRGMQPQQQQHQHQIAGPTNNMVPTLNHKIIPQGGPAPHYTPGQQQQQGMKRRYEPDFVDQYTQDRVMNNHQMVARPNMVEPQQQYQQQTRIVQQQQCGPLRQQPQVSKRQHMLPACGQNNTSDSQLLGNPTPPLTPTANPHLNAALNHSSPSGYMMSSGHGPATIHHQPIDQQQQQWQHQQQEHAPHGAYASQTIKRTPPPPPQQQLIHHEPSGHLVNNGGSPAAGHQPAPNSSQLSAATTTTGNTTPASAQRPAVNMLPAAAGQPEVLTRLSLPLRDSVLLGPFKLEQAASQSKVFHLKQALFEQLQKSFLNSQQATVTHELQLRSYLVKTSSHGAGNSNHYHHHHNSQHGDSLLAANQQQQQPAPGSAPVTRILNWPECVQIVINQNLITLSGSKLNRAIDIFQYCQMGDNLLEISILNQNQDFSQYNNYDFILEAIERPTMKAFINSCFKSRILSSDLCLTKLRNNFGLPGFIIQSSTGIFNDYINESSYDQPQQVIAKVKISPKCPITMRRIKSAPARGQACKHLQCFDLENFLYLNRDKTQWFCPLCSQLIPFPTLELDEYLMNILKTMNEQQITNPFDELLIDSQGSWQIYSPSSGGYSINNTVQPQQQQAPALAQAPSASQMVRCNSSNYINGNVPPSQPVRPMSGPAPQQQHRQAFAGSSPTACNNWQPTGELLDKRPTSASMQQQQQQQTGRRSGSGSPLLLKKQSYQPQQQSSSVQAQQQVDDELSPLAAMERAIIQHEQQMGPPPFDPNSLTSSPSLNKTSCTHQQSPSGLNQSNAQTATPYSPLAAAGGNTSPQQQQHKSVPAAAASPRQQPAQSPMSHQTILQQTSVSTPATPSIMGIHGGPETPATPSGSHHCGPSSVPPAQQQQQQQQSSHNNVVDHQPLSNGSASAGSITSTSTSALTPGNQSSLGSVGMGGDSSSRCGTAPLQSNNTASSNSVCLDDLIPINGGGSQGKQQISLLSQNSQSTQANHHHHPHHHLQHGAIDEKNEQILMNKLMMDHQSSNDIGLALEEVEWKQQLEARGKSEHLANFLNEPAITNRKLAQQFNNHDSGSSKMLSGGIAGSSDEEEAEQQQQSQQLAHQQQHLDSINDQYVNYLETDSADNGPGLPPDDSILDLFER